MTDFGEYGPFDDGIPVPDRTVGRRPRSMEKQILINEGVELCKMDKGVSYKSAALNICPRYYQDWVDNPILQPGRIEILAKYISRVVRVKV